MYIRNSMRWQKCNRIGHTINRCNQQQTCVKCGSTDTTNNYNYVEKCINCSVQYPTQQSIQQTKKCPAYLKRKRLLNMTNTKNNGKTAIKQYVEQTTKIRNKPTQQLKLTNSQTASQSQLL